MSLLLVPEDSQNPLCFLLPSAHVAAWKCITNNPWVITTMTQGYRLQFVTRPPLSRVLTISSTSSHSDEQALLEEIKTLLEKEAVQELRLDEAEVLFPLLFRAKEKWHFSTHIGPQRSEQICKTSTIQDINYSKSETGCTSGGLVCIHRPERCFFQIPIWEGHRRFPHSVAGCFSSTSYPLACLWLPAPSRVAWMQQ